MSGCAVRSGLGENETEMGEGMSAQIILIRTVIGNNKIRK